MTDKIKLTIQELEQMTVNNIKTKFVAGDIRSIKFENGFRLTRAATRRQQAEPEYRFSQYSTGEGKLVNSAEISTHFWDLWNDQSIDIEREQ